MNISILLKDQGFREYLKEFLYFTDEDVKNLSSYNATKGVVLDQDVAHYFTLYQDFNNGNRFLLQTNEYAYGAIRFRRPRYIVFSVIDNKIVIDHNKYEDTFNITKWQSTDEKYYEIIEDNDSSMCSISYN